MKELFYLEKRKYYDEIMKKIDAYIHIYTNTPTYIFMLLLPRKLNEK